MQEFKKVVTPLETNKLKANVATDVGECSPTSTVSLSRSSWISTLYISQTMRIVLIFVRAHSSNNNPSKKHIKTVKRV